MKKERFDYIAMFICLFLLSAFIIIHRAGGGIVGTISPTNIKVWVSAIKDGDTIKVEVKEGSFSIADLKPGNYTVVVEAVAPYQSKTLDSIKVKDGLTTNVGMIVLGQR
jgi:hypothetical protein